MAGRRMLATAAAAGLAGLGVAGPAGPATASSRTSPRVLSFSPRAGAAGTTVTVTGSGFTKVTAVSFGGVAAGFRVRSASRITAAVPAMPSAAGRISVTTRAGTAASRARFTVTPAVALSPATGPPGSVVTVSGTGFGALEGADVFVGTSDEALAGTGPAGSFGPIRVTIGAKAVPGTAWISVEGRRSRLFAQAAFTVNTNWTQSGFSADRTGTNPFENVLSTADVAGLGLDWSFRVGNAVQTSPAVANGVLYVAGFGGYVYGLDAATGAELWENHAPHGVVSSSPAVAGGLVYIGSDDHNVYALDAATGARRWTFTTGDFVDSSPAVAGGVVYIGSDDHNVYALDAATGARRWTFTTGNPVTSSPAVAGGLVYVSSGGHLYALNAATGWTRWTFTTGNAGLGSPSVAGGAVYIGGDDGRVYAVTAVTGTRLWTFTTGNPVGFSSPAVAGGVVYIAQDHNVYALDAATGASRWTSTTGNAGLGSPSVANGLVYIGSDNDKLHALDAATGAMLWTSTTASPRLNVVFSPAVANGMVYISSQDLHVYAFGLPGGTATPARPDRTSLHPDYHLTQQR